MINIWIKKACLFLIISSIGVAVQAVEVEFPEEELATESVLPVFDHKVVVKNRNVVLAERFEFGFGGGVNLTEALYQNKNINFNATYHLSETHGIHLSYFQIFEGLTAMGEDLAAGKGLEISNDKFNAAFAPSVQSMLVADYQFVAYYGKVSLTKNFTMNLSVYGLAGGQYIGYTEGSTFGLNAGLGQKIYFGKNFGIRTDLRFMAYSGLDPTTNASMHTIDDVNAPHSYNDFSESFYLHSYLTVSLVFLL